MRPRRVEHFVVSNGERNGKTAPEHKREIVYIDSNGQRISTGSYRVYIGKPSADGNVILRNCEILRIGRRDRDTGTKVTVLYKGRMLDIDTDDGTWLEFDGTPYDIAVTRDEVRLMKS